MCRLQLEQTFCWKISSELKLFKNKMLQKTKEEIYASAYEIDCMVRIYEILVEQSKRMETEQLECCIHVSFLLSFLYAEWLKIPDTQNEELEDILCSFVNTLLKKERGGFNEEIGIDVKVG